MAFFFIVPRISKIAPCARVSLVAGFSHTDNKYLFLQDFYCGMLSRILAFTYV